MIFRGIALIVKIVGKSVICSLIGFPSLCCNAAAARIVKSAQVYNNVQIFGGKNDETEKFEIKIHF